LTRQFVPNPFVRARNQCNLAFVTLCRHGVPASQQLEVKAARAIQKTSPN